MSHSNMIGGSTAARAINCPASITLSARMPPGPASYAAREGTVLHNICESVLLGITTIDEWAGKTIDEIEITPELYVDKLIPALTATDELFKRLDVHPEDYLCEQVVHFQGALEGCFGTTDILAVGRDGLPVVADFKFGHQLIKATGNAQLLFYAAAAAEDPDTRDIFEDNATGRVMLAIIQPTDTAHPLKTWEVDVEALPVYRAKLVEALERAGTAEPSRGSHCRWCPAAPLCPEQNDLVKQGLQLDGRKVNQLAEAMTIVDDVENWCRQVRKLAHESLERGTPLPGYKLVAKRATRKWGNESAILKKLKAMRSLSRAKYLQTRLESPAQLEKVCKANGVDFEQFNDYIVKTSVGTTVVEEDDPRDALLPAEGVKQLNKLFENESKSENGETA